MRELLTAAQVAKMLNVSVPRVYELARLGILYPVRLGRQVRFSEERLRAWIADGGQALPGGWKWRPGDGHESFRDNTGGRNG